MENRFLVKSSEEPSANSSLSYRIEYAFLCPPHGLIERVLTGALLMFLSLAVPWSILGPECLPGSNIFSLIVVINACVIGGNIVSIIKIPSVPPLPPLLGMLIIGFCLRNIPCIDIAKDIDHNWSSALRSLALTIILVKAGLELDATALKKMKGVCLRLSAIPCLVETATCAVACRLLLGFPWEWGFMLGFVLGAVTPAVIVPSLLALQEEGYGVDQGIPTLVIAASSFDDVLAISGFSVVLGIAFSQVSSDGPASVTESNFTTSNASAWNESSVSPAPDEAAQTTGELVWTVFRGPVEMVAGILVGALVGMVLWFLPASNIRETVRDRVLAVVGCGTLALFGSRAAGFPGAGALAAIVLAFVSAMSWKSGKEKVSEYVGVLWNIFEPIMFGLIGAEISLESMEPGTIGLGLAVLFIGLSTRTLSSYLSVSCGGFSTKEKIFISLAWLPKATVQAAIGPMALDTAWRAFAPPEIENLAKQVLTIAVLSILITAPLGAAAIGLSGPKLLRKSAAHPAITRERVSLSRYDEGKNREKDVLETPLTEVPTRSSVGSADGDV